MRGEVQAIEMEIRVHLVVIAQIWCVGEVRVVLAQLVHLAGTHSVVSTHVGYSKHTIHIF